MYTLEDIYNDIRKGASLERIHRNYGGFSIYIQRQRPDYKEKILEEFNGYNYDALAHKYNTTPSNVREILKCADKNEKSLFD